MAENVTVKTQQNEKKTGKILPHATLPPALPVTLLSSWPPVNPTNSNIM